VAFPNAGPGKDSLVGHDSAVTTVYVYLPNESVEVWRPVEAKDEGNLVYRLADTPATEDEVWEFPPGSRVRCEWRNLGSGPTLVAVGLA
jgi:hypothetical protein